MSDEEWKEYLEEYQQEHNKHLKQKEEEIPALMELLQRFDDEMYKPTKMYKFIRKTQKKIEQDLKLNEEQKRLINYWRECEDMISDDIVEYAFIYGYSLAMNSREESKRIINNL